MPKLLNGFVAPRTAPWSTMKKRFNAVVDKIIKALGSPSALVIAAAVIVVWAVTGPIFGFSDTWQLVINTSTTIVTFLMVFVIQNSQNRDSKAVHIKLDELIEALGGARNRLAAAELESDEKMDSDMRELRAKAGAGDSSAAESSDPSSTARRRDASSEGR